MRRFLWLIFAGLSMTAWMGSCQKSSSSNMTIVGVWELSAFIGGLAGTIPYPPGNGNLTQFYANGTYRTWDTQSGGSGTGTYQVVSTGLPGRANILIRKIDSSSQVLRDSVMVSGDQLSIFDPPKCCDQVYEVTFRRYN